MLRGFHFGQTQPIERVMPQWLINQCPSAIGPHANGTRHLRCHTDLSVENKVGGEMG